MEVWALAFKVAVIGFTAVFLGLCMLAAGVKVMSFCCRLVTKKEKKEA
jgi:Na+-transporting methylmalonyl-CoA/oxaloacetate decarboxylase gamma subunit